MQDNVIASQQSKGKEDPESSANITPAKNAGLTRVLGGAHQAHSEPEDSPSITTGSPCETAAAKLPFNEDAFLRLRDEPVGIEDDFDDVGAAVLAIKTHLAIKIEPSLEDTPSITRECLRDFICWIVLLIWELLADGLISPTRAQALSDGIARGSICPSREKTARA